MTTTIENQEFIQVEQAPDIPHLKFRHFRGESDYPHLLAVINGSKEADGVEQTTTIEDLGRIFAHLDNCDPFKDMLIAEVSGEVISFNRVWWSLEYSGEYKYTLIGKELPAWRGKGIGTAMLHHGEDRLRQIARKHPADSAKFFQSWASEDELALNKLMKKEDYQPVRYFFDMTRPIADPIPDAPMPDGLEVRPVLEADYSKIFSANDKGFQDHWGNTPTTENEIKRFVDSPIFDPSIWKVAWDGEEVAGMVLNFVDKEENEEYQRKRGYTEDIIVVRAYRKRGLAKSLIAQSIAMFRDMGMHETALGVDAENLSGALKLYENLGYQTKKRFTVFRKPLD